MSISLIENIHEETDEDLKELVGRVVAIDFDGVIHSYHEGYKDGSIYGYVLPGAREFIKDLKKRGFRVVINTSRVMDIRTNKPIPEVREELENWLRQHDIPFDDIFPKVVAVCYIDDRAVRVDPMFSDSLSWENKKKEIEEVISRRI